MFSPCSAKRRASDKDLPVKVLIPMFCFDSQNCSVIGLEVLSKKRRRLTVRACDAVQFQTVTVAKSVAQFVRTAVEFSVFTFESLRVN